MKNVTHVAAISILCTMLPTALAADQWRGYSYNAAAHPAFQALEQLGEAVSEATDNELSFTWNVGGSLPIPAANITQALGDGLVDIAGDGFYTSSISVGGIAFLPMLWSTREDVDKGYAALEPYLAEALEGQGVKLLGHYYYPLQTAFANVEVTSLEDFRGKTVRVSSGEQAEFVRRLGGTPVTIGTPEVPTSLQRGVIDIIFTASSGGARGYYEMLTHNFRLGPNFHLSLIGANLDKFNALTLEHQQILMDAANEAGARATARYMELEEQQTAEYEAGGMVITRPDEETVAEVLELMDGYWNEWAEEHGATAIEALDAVRAAIGK